MKTITIFALNEVMPPHGDMPGITDTSVHDFLKEFKAHAHFIMRLGLLAAVWVYVLSPVFTLGIPLPAFWLSEKKRVEHMKRYSNSKNFVFAQLWMLLKMIAGLCWGKDDKVRAYFGYTPYAPELGEFKKGDNQ